MKNQIWPLTLFASLLLLGAVGGCADDDDDDDDDNLVEEDGGIRFDAGLDAGFDAAFDAGLVFPDGATPDAGDTHVFRPIELPFTATTVNALTVPPGFQVEVFESGLGNARMLAIDEDDDSVYVTRPLQGDVLRLRDTDGDGEADERDTLIDDLPGVHGIAIHQGKIYLADVRRILVATLDEGDLGPVDVLVDDLPSGGQHGRRTLGFGPDDRLYVSIGSSCDACAETDPEHATLLRVSSNGETRSVYASGLRNTLGFAWHPVTDQLWGSDHGSDFRGDDQPPDELNQIEMGKDYGWPYCFGNKLVDPIIAAPPTQTKADYCEDTEGADFVYPAHSAPIGLVFYTGSMFPGSYRNDAFVAFRGSWNRFPPTGYEVVRVRFENGQPIARTKFLSGFLTPSGRAERGRVAGLAVDDDGALLVSEDRNGVIYRVTYDEDEDAGVDEDAGL